LTYPESCRTMAIMRVRIGLITAPRANGVDTLSRTIHSMRGEDREAREALVGVFNDGTEMPTLTEKVDYVIVRDSSEWGEILKLREKQLYIGAPNLVRALRWAAQDSDIAIVSEDDILMSRDWMSRAEALMDIAKPNVFRPMVCLSHAHKGTELFVQTEFKIGDDELCGWGEKSWGNGMSPVVTTPDVALDLADTIEEYYSTIEPDTAVFRAAFLSKVCTGFYTDPCFGMHMDMGSTYSPKRHWSFASTKRFRPW
jgi:hypothetical protein